MADRAAIENAINNFALGYDSRDEKRMAGSFTDDCVLTMQIAGGDVIGPFEGHAAVMKLFIDSLAQQDDQRRHVTTNIVVDDETDDRATAWSYLTLVTVKDGALKVISSGVYKDEVVRVDGSWKVRRRHIALDLPY